MHAMDEAVPDESRRRLMTGASLAGAAIATIGSAVPFAVSLTPSRLARGEGAPVTVDLQALESGRLHVVPWRRKPAWVLFRTPAMLESLAGFEGELADPNSEVSDQPENCTNATRSVQPEIFVAIGVCTHLGCSPASAPGGFLCACHGSNFDFAGRVFKGSPAPTNLPIPPHYFTDDGMLVIGAASAAA